MALQALGEEPVEERMVGREVGPGRGEVGRVNEEILGGGVGHLDPPVERQRRQFAQ